MVDALTRQDGEDYEGFVRRVVKTPGAKLIKEADIDDNYGRLHLVQDERTRSRLREKYESALSLLRK